ncbi:MAG: RNA polymerase sigma factor [Planctomycetota bacterium]|jgi:RNA polymerase sigma-70 factor (ECF subfamily)
MLLGFDFKKLQAIIKMTAITYNPVFSVALQRRSYLHDQIAILKSLIETANLLVASENKKTEPSTVAISDLQDINKSLNGDSQAYKRLIEKYQQHISKILWKFTRDQRTHQELVQDVFVEAFLSLDTYKAKAPLEHWLAKIAVRVGYRYFKQQKRQRKTENFTFEQWDQLARRDEPENIEPDEAGEIIYELLAQLPPRDRLVLTLRFLQQHDVESTAKLTGWTPSMVKVQTFRAKIKLKKLFLQSGKEIEL